MEDFNELLISNLEEYNNYIPEAKFDLSGLFTITPLIIKLKEMVEQRTGKKFPVTSIYGSPSLPWNGGRIVLEDYGYSKEDNAYDKDLVLLKEKNINPILTFSNHRITPLDLEHEGCNKILEKVDKISQGQAEVRVTNNLLKEYITTQYPKIKINASVIKVELDGGQGNLAYYKGLEEKYNRYVVHPNDNFNYQLLKELDKTKAEILVNERCFLNCVQRSAHYNSIAGVQKKIPGQQREQEKILSTCQAIPEIKQAYSQKRNISLKVIELEKLYNMGFRYFKLQGRIDNPYVFFFDVIRYTVKDEFVAAQMYIPFCDFINKYQQLNISKESNN